MALQSSGAISLNDIHVEAGGSSGTQASLNDSDIRGLISKGSGSQMSFNEWYGASGVTTETNYSNGTPSYYYYQMIYHFYNNEEYYGIVWNSNAVVSNSNASYNFFSYTNINNTSTLASNLPFPAHSGTIGGWRYFGRRSEAGYYSGDEFVSYVDWNANRTTSSTYPF